MQIKEIKKMSDKYDFPVEETRYVIADDDGKIVDDAQGYGYKTKQNAMKAMWWKFKSLPVCYISKYSKFLFKSLSYGYYIHKNYQWRNSVL